MYDTVYCSIVRVPSQIGCCQNFDRIGLHFMDYAVLPTPKILEQHFLHPDARPSPLLLLFRSSPLLLLHVPKDLFCQKLQFLLRCPPGLWGALEETNQPRPDRETVVEAEQRDHQPNNGGTDDGDHQSIQPGTGLAMRGVQHPHETEHEPGVDEDGDKLRDAPSLGGAGESC